MKKVFSIFLLSLLIAPSILSMSYNMRIYEQKEYSWLINLIDSDPYSAYNYAKTISQNITINTTISHYSYRVVGSPGARAVFDYLKSFSLNLGLNVKEQVFEFKNWDIYSEPNITIINENHTYTLQIYPEHYSYGTPPDGVNGTLVYLPLPETISIETFPKNISDYWNATDITGKIVIIGREVRNVMSWRNAFLTKIMLQKPKAILYIWATKEFEAYPRYFSSNGGRIYPEYRALKIPIAWIPIKRTDSLINSLLNGTKIEGVLRVPINETVGDVKNLIVTIPGKDKSKVLLVTAHYDSVMTPAFSDNAAGVSGVMELEAAFAKAYMNNTYTPPINISFVFFTGEEVGLIGSAKFLESYKSLLENSLVADINIDTLGSYTLEVATDSVRLRFLDKEVYPYQLIKDAADTLGVSVRMFSDAIHSDDSTFSHPSAVYNLISYWWPELQVDISDVEPFPATMIGSYPYLPWQMDSQGRVGWIHTPYDNSSSTQNYDWVNPQRLEKQIKVAGIAIYNALELYRAEEETTQGNNTQWIPYETILLYAVVSLVFVVLLYITYRRITRRKS